MPVNGIAYEINTFRFVSFRFCIKNMQIRSCFRREVLCVYRCVPIFKSLYSTIVDHIVKAMPFTANTVMRISISQAIKIEKDLIEKNGTEGLTVSDDGI